MTLPGMTGAAGVAKTRACDAEIRPGRSILRIQTDRAMELLRGRLHAILSQQIRTVIETDPRDALAGFDRLREQRLCAIRIPSISESYRQVIEIVGREVARTDGGVVRAGRTETLSQLGHGDGRALLQQLEKAFVVSRGPNHDVLRKHDRLQRNANMVCNGESERGQRGAVTAVGNQRGREGRGFGVAWFGDRGNRLGGEQRGDEAIRTFRSMKVA